MRSDTSHVEFWPVAEAYASDSAAWPVWKAADFAYVRLGRSTPRDQVGTVVVRLLGEAEPNLSAAEAVERIVLAEEPRLAGGIELTSCGGCVVRPGCCCGIEERHEWRAFLETGESPWAGHDPSPWLERRRNAVQIWSDGGGAPGDDACWIELPVEDFRRGLDSVERRLLGFADRLREWSPEAGARLAAWFVAAFGVGS